MNTTASVNLDALADSCINRTDEILFDLSKWQLDEFKALCRGSSILVTGAAGFIAQATLGHIIAAEPRVLHLLDSSENGLTALARKLATSRTSHGPIDVNMILADITSPLFPRAVANMGQLDLVLHFAAAKHVRSERDSASALRIIDVNVQGTAKLLECLTNLAQPPRIFAVSTDKAASPTSMMGASKLLMESLLWTYPGYSNTTRFANVLFSSGSITESWLDRLSQQVPLSAPEDTHRYFVTPRESGRICANAITSPRGTITVPNPGSLEPMSLVNLAGNFLQHFGLVPSTVALSDWEARPERSDPRLFDSGRYPLVVTPRDTTGEKQLEVFLGPGEKPIPSRNELAHITHSAVLDTHSVLGTFKEWSSAPDIPVTVLEIRKVLAAVIPGFQVSTSASSLDSRI